MQLTVLGRYGRYAPPAGACNAHLLESGTTKILLDAGPGAVARLGGKIFPGALDAVVLTHFHGDHAGDLLSLFYMWARLTSLKKVTHKLRVLIPDAPADAVSYHKKQFPGVSFETIEAGKAVRIGDFSLTFFETEHPVKCFGVRAEAGGRVLAYTADAAGPLHLDLLLEGAHAVLGDACTTQAEYYAGSPHLSVRQLAELCKGKKLYLTHLSDDNLEEVLTEAGQQEPSSELVQEMHTYEI